MSKIFSNFVAEIKIKPYGITGKPLYMTSNIWNDIVLRNSASRSVLCALYGSYVIRKSYFDPSTGNYTFYISWRHRLDGCDFSTCYVCRVVLRPLKTGKGYSKKPISDELISTYNTRF